MREDVIQGTFSDFRLVKGRKVAQIVIEVPIEVADMSLSVLGGVPRPDRECWVAIARLNLTAKSEPSHKMSQQAAMCCRSPEFMQFVNASDEQAAAHWVRKRLQIGSRAELDTDPEAAERWEKLHSEYQEWRRAG